MAGVRVLQLPRWRRLILASMRRRQTAPRLELFAVIAMLLIGAATWYFLASGSAAQRLLQPGSVVLILLANLAPAIVLVMLVGRRIAHKRARRSMIGTSGQLHARLVALFSMIATVPMLLMVIIASLLFQYGVDIWYSRRASEMFESTTKLSQELYAEKQQRVVAETTAMAGDIAQILEQISIDNDEFANEFAYQIYRRELSEGAVLSISAKNGVQGLALVNPYDRPAENWVAPAIAQQLLAKPRTIFGDTGQRMEAVTPLPRSKSLFLYASRVTDSQTLAKAKTASTVLQNYKALINRSARLQILLNLALYSISLLIIIAAVYVALRVADRLVRPVGELVGAARRIAAGDLAARVTPTRSRDEVGVLSRAFNRMTEKLSEQNNALVESNELLDRRRALIEAVMSSVTAGVIAVTQNGEIRLLNAPASLLINVDTESAVGQSLATLSPELGAVITDKAREGIIQIVPAGEGRTLAVRVVRDEVGSVITFDDITEQLVDQRRAAWSDVARRVAHEIKNPLTPIQLAAERLQRRFAKEVGEDQAAFERLTGTIVRQVGDLRRMVDEFSSFARMPKPVFATEAVVDVVREAVFLHEVANPKISFKVVAPTPSPSLVCDRRQLAQAISNVVKNGVEAIQQKPEMLGEQVTVTVRTRGKTELDISVSDTGIGLPVERDRIIEPYMTTRPGGTGLGLPIVGKVIEEHQGTIKFEDRPGGGAVVTMSFDRKALAQTAQARVDRGAQVDPHDVKPVELTRKRSA